ILRKWWCRVEISYKTDKNDVDGSLVTNGMMASQEIEPETVADTDDAPFEEEEEVRRYVIAKLNELKAQKLNKEKCTDSLREKLENHKGPKETQKKQFNLGNGFEYADPLEAAAHLLKRDYGNSFLFGKGDETIFIPPVFVSEHHTSAPIQEERLFSDIKEHRENLSQNYKWFSDELDDRFMIDQKKKYNQKKKYKKQAMHYEDYKSWITKTKLQYLLREELKPEDHRRVPKTKVNQTVVAYVKECQKLFEEDLSETLKSILQLNEIKEIKTKVNDEVAKKKPDEALKWFFDKEIPHWKKVACLDYDDEKKIRVTYKNVRLPEEVRKELKVLVEKPHITQGEFEDFKKWLKEWLKERPHIDEQVVEWLRETDKINDGDRTEQLFYKKLYALKEEAILKNSLILSGVNIKIPGKRGKSKEFDFLIFYPLHKLLINIELKRSATKENIDTADEQFIKGDLLLKYHFGDILDGWTVYPVFGYSKENDVVKINDQFKENNHVIAIDEETNFEKWLRKIIKEVQHHFLDEIL
uniref:Uncharacterized protein n=1 Tax=Clytia hemisphaerica TaxID=252671 RepID=A0A7M6DQ51_9CNID